MVMLLEVLLHMGGGNACGISFANEFSICAKKMLMGAWPHAVCMFDGISIWHSTFKSKVSCDVSNNKNECQLTSTLSSRMSPQWHA